MIKKFSYEKLQDIVLRFLSVSRDGNNNIEKWRQEVIYTDFIQTKPLFTRKYKQQLLDWFKFMLIMLFLLSKIKLRAFLMLVFIHITATFFAVVCLLVFYFS